MVDTPTDYKQTNTASVTDDGGTNPTIDDKAHPIIITWGNSSPGTGSGDCEFGSITVDGPEDIGVFDTNDNLHDFEIEELDTTNKEATVWVYFGSLARDNTDQVKVAAGTGSTDDQNVTGTWGNTGQNAFNIQHLNGNAIDSTSNNNDGTVNGATQIDAEFADGYRFDGTDDNIVYNSNIEPTTNFAVSIWFKTTTTNDYRTMLNEGSTNFTELTHMLQMQSDGSIDGIIANSDGTDATVTSGTGFNDGNWHLAVLRYDGSTLSLNIDDNTANTVSTSISAESSLSDPDTAIASSALSDLFVDIDMDEFKIFNSSSGYKDSDWVQAEYDSSPKAGQVFFSWNGAEPEIVAGSVAVTSNGVKQTSSGVVQTQP